MLVTVFSILLFFLISFVVQDLFLVHDSSGLVKLLAAKLFPRHRIFCSRVLESHIDEDHQ